MHKRLTHLLNNHGFTMIEMMIVIAIIGILATVGVGNFLTTQARARDARRRADMQAIQKGFEQYYLQGSAYGATCGVMLADTALFPQGAPTDPKNTSPNVYSSSNCSTSTYCYCARLERAGSGNSGANCAYTATDKDYYCVSQLQ